MYHNGCVHHIVFGDDLEWFPRTHNPGSLRQLLYRCTCCTCCTGTLGTAGTAAVQHTRLGQQLLYAVPAVPLYLLYRCTAVPAVPPGLRRSRYRRRPAGSLTAASHSDARQVGRQNPVKSRGNRVQTRALLDLHVDINDLSDYACTLAIHMTNIILTTCIDEERYASGPHRLRQSARPPKPRARPIRASQQPPTTPGAGAGRAGAREQRKDTKCGPRGAARAPGRGK